MPAADPTNSPPVRVLLIHGIVERALRIKESLQESQGALFQIRHETAIPPGLSQSPEDLGADLVLLGMASLPDAAHSDVLRRVLDWTRIPIIVLLDPLDEPELAAQAVRLGAQDCLHDAPAPCELSRAILCALERHRQRARTELELRQTQKMDVLGKLAGGIVHDFNNLLTAITGHAELLLGVLDASDPNHVLAREISSAADRAAELTRQLLAFSKTRRIELALVDLNQAIEEMKGLLSRLIGEDIAVSICLAASPAIIRADAGQVQQVIANLAVNARDAMPHGGKLTIRTETMPGPAGESGEGPTAIIKLCVTDTGSGMDDRTQARIFEPFFTTKGERGNGLGLATVQRIVKGWEGSISFQSRLGRGTTFEILLPAARGQVEPGSHETSAPARVQRGSETILLVEDDAAVRQLLVRTLTGQGYSVLQAADGEEALALGRAHQGAIDMLVTDAVMPNMSGGALAQELSNLRPGVKVIFMSGYSSSGILRRGQVLASAAVLIKPFPPQTLLRKIREVLDG